MPCSTNSRSAAECSGAQLSDCIYLPFAAPAGTIEQLRSGQGNLPIFRILCQVKFLIFAIAIPSEIRKKGGSGDLEKEVAMLDAATIERALERTGKSKGGLARAMGVRPGAVSEILSGIRLIKASEIGPIMDYLGLNSVPIMGRVGAGATIEPENEQVPPEGLGEVELPFPISGETIAFEVSGDSMLPKYENGDVIVVYREQRHPLASFFGEEAVVRLKTGDRK